MLLHMSLILGKYRMYIHSCSFVGEGSFLTPPSHLGALLLCHKVVRGFKWCNPRDMPTVEKNTLETPRHGEEYIVCPPPVLNKMVARLW